MSSTRVVIADDHVVVRTGLRTIIEREPDLQLVGEAADGAEAVAQTEALRPDVVVLDLGMPVMGGLEAARRIRARHPQVGIVVLTVYDDEAYLRQSLRAGVMGYLLKSAADRELVSAIRSAARGESSIDQALIRQLIDLYRDRDRPGMNLSAREQEILRLIALGFTGQEIGDQLGISVSTVETHRSQIMRKLGLERRSELVHWALRNGLI